MLHLTTHKHCSIMSTLLTTSFLTTPTVGTLSSYLYIVLHAAAFYLSTLCNAIHNISYLFMLYFTVFVDCRLDSETCCRCTTTAASADYVIIQLGNVMPFRLRRLTYALFFTFNVLLLLLLQYLFGYVLILQYVFGYVLLLQYVFGCTILT